MPIDYRFAAAGDLDLLAEWNHQLIRDEGHRNPMTPAELRARMAGWLAGGYRAVVFLDASEPVAYALYHESATEIYLRHLFVRRDRRREGIGRQAMTLLRNRLWPRRKRLTVEVLTANTPALSSWRALGFHDYALTLEIMPEPDFVSGDIHDAQGTNGSL
jgi:GNAT superfamily N-acetyltransferase